MGEKCGDCKNSFPAPVYEFHHLNPKEKERNPSYLFRKGWKATEEELLKCVMLCANCHRIRHWMKDTQE